MPARPKASQSCRRLTLIMSDLQNRLSAYYWLYLLHSLGVESQGITQTPDTIADCAVGKARRLHAQFEDHIGFPLIAAHFRAECN